MRDAESYRDAKKLLNQDRFAEAFSLYERLAKAGDAHSQVFLGWMYFEGLGVEQDKEKALEWFMRAASLGSIDGAYYCGRCALSMKNYHSALDWFGKAAVQDYGPALLGIGVMHLRGLGIPVDIEKGVTYLKRAMDAGDFLARRELAVLMIRGKLGVSRIPVGLLLFPYAVIGAVITGFARMK